MSKLKMVGIIAAGFLGAVCAPDVLPVAQPAVFLLVWFIVSGVIYRSSAEGSPDLDY